MSLALFLVSLVHRVVEAVWFSGAKPLLLKGVAVLVCAQLHTRAGSSQPLRLRLLCIKWKSPAETKLPPPGS